MSNEMKAKQKLMVKMGDWNARVKAVVLAKALSQVAYDRAAL